MDSNISQLKNWFLDRRRDLPWRQDPTPYAVWVSEVMLQQTQVAVVIPYFVRWMQRFPTVEALAEVSVDEVIKLWEGLGYYSRARNLHAGARYVVDALGGVLPNDPAMLAKIKGLGPYTVAAIRAFAFHEKALAVDGNVLRVLSRYFDLHEDIGKPSTVSELRERGEALLPDVEPWIVAEALIELGATVCRRSAECKECPLGKGCLAQQRNTYASLPVRRQRPKTEKLFRAVAVIKSARGILLRRGEVGKIMHDLHEFPYFETEKSGMTAESIAEQMGVPLELDYRMPKVTHSFTKYHVTLDPFVFSCPEPTELNGFQWHEWEQISQLAFSSGHRRVLKRLMQEH